MHTSVARAAGITDGEKKITKILVKELEPTFVEVKDISGMYKLTRL